MRLKNLIAAAGALVALAFLSPGTAQAFGDRDRPDGWDHTRTIKHWVYYPRYNHYYRVDPYAWRYSPRGYYPYYGSHYWAKADYLRHRKNQHLNVWNTQPPRFRYYKSWGYPRKWHNRAWHAEHDGRIHPWHW